MFCGGFVFLIIVGIDGVKLLYIMKSLFCWGLIFVGYYYVFEVFVYGFGSVIGIFFFGCCFKELNVVCVGMVIIILVFIILVFFGYIWIVFVGKYIFIRWDYLFDVMSLS